MSKPIGIAPARAPGCLESVFVSRICGQEAAERTRLEGRLELVGVSASASEIDVDAFAPAVEGGRKAWLAAAASSGAKLTLEPREIDRLKILRLGQERVDRGNGALFQATEKLDALAAALTTRLTTPSPDATLTMFRAFRTASDTMRAMNLSEALTTADETQFNAFQRALGRYRVAIIAMSNAAPVTVDGLSEADAFSYQGSIDDVLLRCARLVGQGIEAYPTSRIYRSGAVYALKYPKQEGDGELDRGPAASSG